jgi:hypothetical protein
MSKEAALRALEAQLGGKAPKGLKRLSAEELEELGGAVRHARRRQAKALGEAGDKAFGHIPWLLRGPIRKIVG